MRHHATPLAPLAGALLLLPTLAAAAPRTYQVDATASRVIVHVGKGGAFGFAGHTHEVAAPVSGAVVADAADPAASSLDLRFSAAALTVLPEGEPAGDPPKVQEIMRGPRVLDAARFATITARSRQVRAESSGAGAYAVTVTLDLGLHGVTRALTVPVKVTLQGDRLTASGHAELRQTEFGIEPVTAAGGTVKVKDAVTIDFTIVAEAGR